MPSDRRLLGRRAVVTGTSRGIGHAIAIALAHAGADVVGVSRSDPGPSGGPGRAIEAAGRRYTHLRADLTDRASIERLTRGLLSDGGVPDILVLAAGMNVRSPAARYLVEDWDEVVHLNLTAPFLIARDIGGAMLDRGSGRIIFVASLLAFQGGYRAPAYAASKGGVAQLTKALSNEWAASGINVNAVAPGYVRTEMTEALATDPVRAQQINARIPAGRWAEPSDIAGPVVFLASDEAAYIHGAVLPIDGGWLGW